MSKRTYLPPLQTSIPIKINGPSTSTGVPPNTPFGYNDDSDYYVATPHPQTEGYKAFSELLLNINHQHNLITSDPELAKSSSHHGIGNGNSNDSMSASGVSGGGGVEKRMDSPVPFSPIRRSGNPIPFNLSMESRRSPNLMSTTSSRVFGGDLRRHNVSSLLGGL